MMYKAKVAVCSDIRTKHSTQSERHVEFLNVKPGGTWKVKAESATSNRRQWIFVATILLGTTPAAGLNCVLRCSWRNDCTSGLVKSRWVTYLRPSPLHCPWTLYSADGDFLHPTEICKQHYRHAEMCRKHSRGAADSKIRTGESRMRDLKDDTWFYKFHWKFLGFCPLTNSKWSCEKHSLQLKNKKRTLY